jgi:hypothetical protein
MVMLEDPLGAPLRPHHDESQSLKKKVTNHMNSAQPLHPHHDESQSLKKKVTNHMNSRKFPLDHLEGCPKLQHLKPMQDQSSTDNAQVKHIVQI